MLLKMSSRSACLLSMAKDTIVLVLQLIPFVRFLFPFQLMLLLLHAICITFSFSLSLFQVHHTLNTRATQPANPNIHNYMHKQRQRIAEIITLLTEFKSLVFFFWLVLRVNHVQKVFKCCLLGAHVTACNTSVTHSLGIATHQPLSLSFSISRFLCWSLCQAAIPSACLIVILPCLYHLLYANTATTHARSQDINSHASEC